MKGLFVTDLHGHVERYRKLFEVVAEKVPEAVFLGGDLLPHGLSDHGYDDFTEEVIHSGLSSLRSTMGKAYPEVFVILGNDDPRAAEEVFLSLETEGVWTYVHNRRVGYGHFTIYGYSFVPPTPFQYKAWEKYDVSRYVPPGSVSPEEGFGSVSVAAEKIRYETIEKDLSKLTGDDDLSKAIMLFHTPPHETTLDRAATDGKMIDHVPLDRHVGSIAVRRLIEKRQPLLTLHGHIHESARLTGAWRDRIDDTYLFGAAHDGHELCLVEFDTDDLASATRSLL